jgi:hypothetical protein
MTFVELKLADDTPFAEIAVSRGLKCRDCGDQVEVRPDWHEDEAGEGLIGDVGGGAMSSGGAPD